MRTTLLFLFAALTTGCAETSNQAEASGVHIAQVVAFDPGEGAGFGEPANVLGPPEGAGELRGSYHVLSLGIGGELVVEMAEDIVDGPGDDFRVFEKRFLFWLAANFYRTCVCRRERRRRSLRVVFV